MTEQTYWNGMPTPARRGTAIVADSPQFPGYWARPLIGTRIPVVEVVLDFVTPTGGTDYLDNRDDSAWEKVTIARGGPHKPHGSLAIQPGSFTPDPTPTALAAEPHWTAWSPRLTDVTKPAPTYHEAFVAGWGAASQEIERLTALLARNHRAYLTVQGIDPDDKLDPVAPSPKPDATDAQVSLRAFYAEHYGDGEWTVVELPLTVFIPVVDTADALPLVQSALDAADLDIRIARSAGGFETAEHAHHDESHLRGQAAEPVAIVEIDWAEDRAGKPIEGPVGPFYSEGAADRWAQAAIYNGEWNTAQLQQPAILTIPEQEARPIGETKKARELDWDDTGKHIQLLRGSEPVRAGVIVHRDQSVTVSNPLTGNVLQLSPEDYVRLEQPGTTTADLIEASSFGTPAAAAARATVTDEHAQRLVDAANEISARLDIAAATGNYPRPAPIQVPDETDS